MMGYAFSRTVQRASITVATGPRKTLRILLREYERLLVEKTLDRNLRDRRRTAEALGITLRGLEKILARHGMSRRRERVGEP